MWSSLLHLLSLLTPCSLYWFNLGLQCGEGRELHPLCQCANWVASDRQVKHKVQSVVLYKFYTKKQLFCMFSPAWFKDKDQVTWAAKCFSYLSEIDLFMLCSPILKMLYLVFIVCFAGLFSVQWSVYTGHAHLKSRCKNWDKHHKYFSLL